MTLGRIAYAIAFCAILPLLLMAWAVGLAPSITLPGWHAPELGIALATLGTLLILAAWRALWIHGGGLPMNGFPPARRVSRDVYALMAHPNYIGAGLVVAGISLWTGSAAGLWVITPVFILACAALVAGYEHTAINARFGPPTTKPWLSLPTALDTPATWRERTGVLLIVFIPWLIAYEWCGHLPSSPGAWSGWLGAEQSLPVWEWAEIPYASVYLIVPLACLACTTQASLRRFAINGWTATLLGSFLYIFLPIVTPPRTFEPTTLLGDLLLWERADGLAGRAACPSFHVFWILFAALTLTRNHPRIGPIFWIWSAPATASCWLTGMHSILDLLAGVLFFAIVLSIPTLWLRCLALTQLTANSWREWRLGPVRIINHGLYAGAAAFTGFILASAIAPQSSLVLLTIAGASLVGAAIFGQLVVGSPTLLRPFGYFGSILGASLSMLIASLLGFATWELAAGLAAAAPWVQCIGRLRCLVQGCCHGRLTTLPTPLGIRYQHPRSRVCRLADLHDKPVHPTPLYSMLGNIAIGLILARLCASSVNASLIVGLYAILAGLLRFVEEHFRGEPHTRVLSGLRLYQWLALLMTVIGIAITCLPQTPVIHVNAPPPLAWLLACTTATLYACAMGVDFPESTRRFSRLA